jgi:very-short-patch-repair endonuclease
MLQGSRETVEIARKLRREMSLPEVLLWVELRKRPAGLKFRRQQPASRKVTDFFCHSARLIVEVDGQAHDSIEVAERDARRDAWFERRGIRVLRVPARELLNNLEGALLAIVQAAQAGTPLHHPAAPGGPPPLPGEDLVGAFP